MQLRSGELESLAHREAHNVTVLSQIQQEMRHRGKHPAANDVRDLVARLLQSSEPAPPGMATGRRADRTAPFIRGGGSRRPAATHGAASTAEARPSPPFRYEARYEALRETFTAESEVLARWGMTSWMPRELRHGVFAAWRDLLAHGEHPGGFTLADLETDLRTLEIEHGFTTEEEPDDR